MSPGAAPRGAPPRVGVSMVHMAQALRGWNRHLFRRASRGSRRVHVCAVCGAWCMVRANGDARRAKLFCRHALRRHPVQPGAIRCDSSGQPPRTNAAPGRAYAHAPMRGRLPQAPDTAELDAGNVTITLHAAPGNEAVLSTGYAPLTRARNPTDGQRGTARRQHAVSTPSARGPHAVSTPPARHRPSAPAT